ncbi:oxidoreductase [Mucilaginibacter auburnensis]|uniref:NADP-dependent 3-hydroxy acid dehydrogenase YdfG n=1 Tax=Mucilaginibacter auburnensis TaxID=1457233 RepID=A0A2H9VW69_9SPHI|nr:oxidoreductase [Mucilaginibacter auburnensis]PJJ85070.1 NADP-dependent 3-hydroxy acid dehydrogenase YdfG [Mucilaginibacter auburnensis]
MKKVWFITGASRGLGRSLTELILETGHFVAATARDTSSLTQLQTSYPEQLLAIKLDVTQQSEVYHAVDKALARFGKIDVLVNNAGFGITGAVEAYTEEQVRSQLETNLYAPIEITRAVLPHMRSQRSGHILQVSSVGGRVGSGGVSIYQAAKFGLSGFSEGLAIEVAELGIKVTCVEPGGFKTDWAGDSMTYAASIPDYKIVNQRQEIFQNGTFVPMGDPKKAAQVMLDIVNEPNPPLHLLLGSDAVAIVKSSEAAKLRELEHWEKVSSSTDHDDSPAFLDTDYGKRYLDLKK